ncbi:MAG: cell filamentation protein Fic [Stygiobacter sp. RIFOXYC12_FULL_38_8]|nr:MAG: cell filamentation protein Fic [Stygiobacter sp. RIFOXYA12_FULL_38_9]OGV08436.1 MAG: cell filamentation protein Fic [Stygiobacter sp. RIFOXYB2_FULL_37_11]OGV14397.1 MAG: cell filamentation protein Fic [Stygiobacter sp. RIFOXYC2_FULL_38_25]OGV17547.1 MAG: cell filamentation protein Fic [Stygiobacter sp. RIFOXYA2_FULL_38_8]OGV25520.1 MAG: cell filamentation protein Fic [Stygiobacter sp. RIFOXYC12_FULL_38_8]OGV82157.1 MAG: cell filamentation protein Fic [Stygiobacter sp. GWF2_38_21]RJQ64
MDIKDFKAGTYVPQFQYKSFLPTKINQEWVVSDPQINKLLEEANLKLGELNAFSLIVPDVDLFIKMHIVKEATTSSRIEGTQTHIEEAVLKEKDVTTEKKDDWREVQNYIAALNDAIENLSNLPLSSRLITQIHKILLQSVRGKNKLPGEYRTSQNWIGGATIKDATFIPPHYQDVPELLSDLENFTNNNNIYVPHLIKIAITHYQFETIHPFLDGNGRVGRLLITLYLVANKLLAKPTLYLSDFLEKHRQLYYDNLTVVRTKNDLTQWIKFFLSAVIETAQNGIDTFQKILKLRNEIEDKRIVTLGRKLPMAKNVINYLYKNPLIQVSYVVDELKISKQTANTIINDFVRLGILKEVTGLKKNRMYLFEEYVELFKK